MHGWHVDETEVACPRFVETLLGGKEIVKARLCGANSQPNVPCTVIDTDPSDEERVRRAPWCPWRMRTEVRKELFPDLLQPHTSDRVSAIRVVVYQKRAMARLIVEGLHEVPHPIRLVCYFLRAFFHALARGQSGKSNA